MRHVDLKQKLRAHFERICANCQKCVNNIPRNVGCECIENYNKLSSYIIADIPEKYWNLDLPTIKKAISKQAMDATSAYISKLETNLRTGRGVYISSEFAQSGKSTVGYTIAKEVIKRGGKVFSSSMRDCATAFDSREHNSTEADFIYNKLLGSDLVVIDNLGDFNTLSQTPPYLKHSLEDIYTRRTNNNKPTIITSNLPPNKIVDVFGLPFYDALKNSADFITLTNKGVS